MFAAAPERNRTCTGRILRWMARRSLSFGLLLPLAVFSLPLAASADGLRSRTAPPTVSFQAPLPSGWHSYPGLGAVATSWAYVPGRGIYGPADRLPKGGTLVEVTFPIRDVRFRLLRLVLPHQPAVMLEGTTDTPEYRIEGRTQGWNVMISVDIRNRHPTAAELRVAQRVVSAIRIR